MPDIVGSGGYVYPTTGSYGYLRESQNLNFHEGVSLIQQIPEFQRDYNLGRATITRITEGRPNMMRVLFDMAKMRGAYVTDDVQARWYLEHEPVNRFYLKVQTNQGGTTGSQTATGDFYLAKPADAKRLQAGDLIALNFCGAPLNRNGNTAIRDYGVETGGSVYDIIRDTSYPIPEICEIVEVNYSTGKVTIERNKSGDSATATYTGPGVTVATNATTDPGSNIIYAKDAFFMKMLNSMEETKDDQLIWSVKNTWDYNYVQRVMRKWGSNDLEEKIKKKAFSWRSTFQKNSIDALNAFWLEMEILAMLGIRKEESIGDRYKGYCGGLIETIPSDHVITLYEPNYSSYSTKQGSFNIPYFNTVMDSKFYYGSQEKFLLCGSKFLVAFTIMINYMTQNIPRIVDEWSVKGVRFQTSSGGTLNVIASDALTLNGMADYAVLWDPSTITYGYLLEDIKVVPELPTTNIHLKAGEIFGDITFKRTNPDANWLFVLLPNNQS
jgi:hypothetical protein